MTKKDILLSNDNKFKYCKFFAAGCPGAVIEANSWQFCDSSSNQGKDKNILNYNKSFMFCIKGWGYIYFKNSGQEIGTYIATKYTSQFAGYLAYGARGIVDDDSGGFFRLYNAPTLGSNREQLYFNDLYQNYNVDPYGALQSFGGTGKVNTSGAIKYGGQTKDPVNGTFVYNGLERYAIAIAPKLQNPNCDLTKKLLPNNMAYGTCVDISIELDGKTYYIPAIIVDVKAHSAPDGVFQTGIPFGGDESVNTGKKGTIVEWYVNQGEDDKNKSTGLGQFNNSGSIIFYRDEVLK